MNANRMPFKNESFGNQKATAVDNFTGISGPDHPERLACNLRHHFDFTEAHIFC
jgi:hypothetical protein